MKNKSFDSMADDYNNLLLHDHLEKEARYEMREEIIQRRVDEQFNDEMIEFLLAPSAVYDVIAESTAEMNGKPLTADEKIRNLLIANFKGDTTKITRALIGDAVVEWFEQWGRHNLAGDIRKRIELDLS